MLHCIYCSLIQLVQTTDGETDETESLIALKPHIISTATSSGTLQPSAESAASTKTVNAAGVLQVSRYTSYSLNLTWQYRIFDITIISSQLR